MGETKFRVTTRVEELTYEGGPGVFEVSEGDTAQSVIDAMKFEDRRAIDIIDDWDIAGQVRIDVVAEHPDGTTTTASWTE